MHRLRTARLAALLVGLAMVAAGCGGGDDEGGGNTSGGSGQVQQGGTLNYAADQEPTGFNNSTSKDNGTSVLNVVINMFPPVYRLHPDYSVQLNKDLMDSATQTSEDPQTIVYKIKQDAAWSDGTPVSADDFEYLWRNLNGSVKGNDVASTTGYDQIESVEGSDNGPYRVSAWDQGQSLTLARNDKYFGPKAHLDSIVFRWRSTSPRTSRSR